MTFSVLVMNDHKPRVVGTLWADDEAKAKTIAPMLYSGEAQVVEVCRTEDREIPFRLATSEPMHFC